MNQTGRTFSYDWDISTDVIVQSPESVDILGFSGDVTSTTGKDFSIAVHPDDLEQLNADIRHLGAANPICQSSLRVFRTDGNIVCLERIGRGFFDQQGRLTRLIGIALEVEEPSLASLGAEAAVRESESRYRIIVETTNEGVWLLDSGLCNSFVNQQMAEMLGYEPEEMVGRSVFDFYFPEDVEQKKQILKRRKEGVREQIEERVRRRDGSELWVRMAVIPMFKDNGEFDGALAMVSDITERKRAEESLRLFRALIDESNDAIEVFDPETMCFLDVNQKAAANSATPGTSSCLYEFPTLILRLMNLRTRNSRRRSASRAGRCLKESIAGKTGRHTRLKSISNGSSWTGFTGLVSFAILRNARGSKRRCVKSARTLRRPSVWPALETGNGIRRLTRSSGRTNFVALPAAIRMSQP